MTANRISIGFLSSAQVHGAMRRDEAQRAPLGRRVIALLKANKFDRMLAVGVCPPEGSALAIHAARLTSVDEREAIARSLRRVVDDARNRNALVSSRMELNVPNITAAQDRIDEVTLRLHSPRPVTPRGVARLRVLLADGAGPMYRYGRGDLEGRLGAALAAL
ncbi:hypothetical protein [Mycolicibacterium stellerae]|uniref:hypothetical protein n=1 Tax=Mycolicibacterium stellerae TaxID=2358193 RepID=UPI002E135A85